MVLAVREGAPAARPMLDEALRKGTYMASDKGLLREIVLGAIRRRRTLDWLIGAHARCPMGRIEPKILALLETAVYQIVFLDRIPRSAAVDEAVKLAGGRRRRGFVNAVLRAVCRSVGEVVPMDAPGGDRRTVISLGRGKGVRLIGLRLPDPETQPAGYLAVAFSYPTPLVSRWLERFGRETTREILEVGNAVPPLFIRANRLKTTREDLMRRLERAGVTAREGAGPQSLEIEYHGSLAELEAFRGGFFQVQDETAQEACLFLGPSPGETILDLCAAPGGKATYMAEIMEDRGEILAVDKSAGKLVLLDESLARLGLRCVKILALDAVRGEVPGPGRFDKALVDVPCTNTGVLRRRVEARWRFPHVDLEALTELQMGLLWAGSQAIRPGGVLVYCTCSIEEEEGRGVVNRFLQAEGSFGLEEERRVLPSPRGGDGGYMARLRRGSLTEAGYLL
jgi:16S rRNA (cytosine967-C5)-methyltransferase